MSEIKVNKISPKQLCTQLTLGDSGDTIIVTSGANFNTDAIKNLNTSSIITQTNATTITLGYSGSTIAIASGATQTGFGRTGTVNWDTTPKTTTVTAVSGTGYFVDTTTTTLTVNLPVGVAGAIVAVSDYANTATTNNISITPNGTDKINGTNFTYKISTNGQAITLVYIDATRGWKDINDATLNATGTNPFVAATGGCVVTCGNYKIHTFTGPGTFTVTNAGGPTGSNSVDYLVVAGGGGGGNSGGGGGGAGGYRESVPSPAAWTASPLASPGGALPVSVQGYPITVGAGGAGGTTAPSTGGDGPTSVFSTITSAGGGGGGSRGGSPQPMAGRPGGSGGGGGGGFPGNLEAGGTGNTPPTSPSQGNNGGLGSPNLGADHQGGGGGGASAVGTNARILPVNGVSAGGNGGNGVASSITGSPVTRGGGGGGGNQASPTQQGNDGPGPVVIGSGGSGGGGNGGMGCNSTFNPVAGSVNTGGGGGGDSFNPVPGGAGGSGIVVIRYKFQ